MVMKHFMVNNAGNDILGDVNPVQRGINSDNFGSVGIAGQFDGLLSANAPPGSPGYVAVYLVGKVILIDLIKKFLEIEVSSVVTKNNSPRFGRDFPNYIVVRSNKISKQRGCFLVPAINKMGQ
jgi:hypothetical protein